MTTWSKNHELAEALCKAGWEYEAKVATFLRDAGLEVQEPEKSWRTDAKDAFAGRYANEIDLLVEGQRVSVKSRDLAFTSADDFPFDTIFVDTCRKWVIKDPAPVAIVCVSQKTDAMIWLPSATRSSWTTRTRWDRVRNYRDTFFEAHKSNWRPIDKLVERFLALREMTVDKEKSA